MQDFVAPYAGAWIEINKKLIGSLHKGSLPTRERGLKWAGYITVTNSQMSLPTRERGLKYIPAPTVAEWDDCRSLRGSVD